MNLQEIKNAVENGKTVCCGNPAYSVKKDSLGQWFIYCAINEYCIGLTHADGVTLNDSESAFYILED